MENLNAGDLTVEVSETPGRLRLDWKGKSNDRLPGKILKPFFDRALAEASKSGAIVELRFERLEHFNSSTITALIQFVQTARNEKVKLVMVYKPSLKWQKLSFDALRIFEKADGILSFETVE